MASEDQPYRNDDDEDDNENDNDGKKKASERQRRMWSAEPSRRDDVLPYFVWSILHHRGKRDIDLKAFIDVS